MSSKEKVDCPALCTLHFVHTASHRSDWPSCYHIIRGECKVAAHLSASIWCILCIIHSVYCAYIVHILCIDCVYILCILCVYIESSHIRGECRAAAAHLSATQSNWLSLLQWPTRATIWFTLWEQCTAQMRATWVQCDLLALQLVRLHPTQLTWGGKMVNFTALAAGGGCTRL